MRILSGETRERIVSSIGTIVVGTVIFLNLFCRPVYWPGHVQSIKGWLRELIHKSDDEVHAKK